MLMHEIGWSLSKMHVFKEGNKPNFQDLVLSCISEFFSDRNCSGNGATPSTCSWCNACEICAKNRRIFRSSLHFRGWGRSLFIMHSTFNGYHEKFSPKFKLENVLFSQFCANFSRKNAKKERFLSISSFNLHILNSSCCP